MECTLYIRVFRRVEWHGKIVSYNLLQLLFEMHCRSPFQCVYTRKCDLQPFYHFQFFTKTTYKAVLFILKVEKYLWKLLMVSFIAEVITSFFLNGKNTEHWTVILALWKRFLSFRLYKQVTRLYRHTL